MMKHSALLVSIVLGLALASLGCVGAERPNSPNILLIMVDDLGFSDFGCYGAEIETPHIDRLAKQGLRFTQFYNTAKCHSSRVSLLTGLYCNQAGGQTLRRGVTIAEALNPVGYRSSMAGKWHLQDEPTDHGFHRYFGHLSGMTDYFHGDKTFRLDGVPWIGFDDEFYTTDAFTDYAIHFMKESLADGKPFFQYIAYNAPHYPLQAPKEDIRKYLGKYAVGWEVIRERRFAKQKRLGLFPSDMSLPPLPAHVPPWTELSPPEQAFEGYRMAVFAAMVDRIDRNIGRLLEFLTAEGVLQNTVILLCSDNGACPFERSDHLDIPPWAGGSFLLYDASWATVSNTPLRHYKQTQHEGGISTPFIVHWPEGLKRVDAWERSPAHLIDVMATCVDLAGAPYPTTSDGETIEPLQGKSLLPIFRGRERPGHDWLYFQFSGCRALRRGDWKAVSFYGHQWELYNIAEDRCEMNDLAAQFPERTEALAELWHQVARNTDQLSAKQTAPVRTTPSPDQKNTWHDPKVFRMWLEKSSRWRQ